MLAELFDRLKKAAETNDKVEFHTHPRFPQHVLVRTAAGVEWRATPPPLRSGTLSTFDDLLQAAQTRELAPRPELYVEFDSVQLLLDRDDRREGYDLPLARTERWTTVESWGVRPWEGTPAEAARILRFQLPDLGAEAEVLAQALSRVDFKRTSTGTTIAQHGRESLGRQVEAVTQQADQIPPEVTLHLPVYQVRGLREVVVDVRVGVWLQPEQEKVRLVPLADELAAAREVATATVASLLRRALVDEEGATTARVLRGTLELPA